MDLFLGGGHGVLIAAQIRISFQPIFGASG